MIYVMGGGQTGATLTVTSSGAGTITVSNTTLGKSYSKSVTAGGSAVFKGLKTGTWTVMLTDGTQTSTKTVVITSDYSTSIAYFSATISITYPATSTCVVKNSSGQTVASNTNTGTSAKTWTATVNATGTYTVTATATDGSGKSKSQSVSITADGQSKTVELGYSYEILNSSVNNTGGWYTAADADNNCYVTPGANNIILHYVSDDSNNWAVASTKNIYEAGNYSTIKCEVEQTTTHDRGPFRFGLSTSTTVGANNNASAGVISNVLITGSGVFSLPLDIDALSNTEFYVRFYVSGVGVAPTATLTVERIWME